MELNSFYSITTCGTLCIRNLLISHTFAYEWEQGSRQRRSTRILLWGWDHRPRQL